MLEGNVVITGGSGSLGNAIVKKAHDENWPCKLTIFSRDEVKQSRMKVRYPDCRYILGDIQDFDALSLAVRKANVVIHAAAYKQVPAAEVNAMAAINTNVVGSMNVVMASIYADVETVIGISTDKACAPINLYGKTKACMEGLFQHANTLGDTKFNLCRYGNVIGSRGSIIPLFKTQAASGGPLTVTDPRMNRFWLTLSQAVEIICQAYRVSVRGGILVPKLYAMKIIDLAWIVAPSIDTKITSIRPGEKIDEHLIHRGESLHTDEYSDYFIVWPAYTNHIGNLPDGFEYRTDNCGRTIEHSQMKDALQYMEFTDV